MHDAQLGNIRDKQLFSKQQSVQLTQQLSSVTETDKQLNSIVEAAKKLDSQIISAKKLESRNEAAKQLNGVIEPQLDISLSGLIIG